MNVRITLLPMFSPERVLGALLLIAFFMAALPARSRADLPPLIRRKLLFGNPERAMARISPDGKWISFLAPSNGVMNLWFRGSDSLATDTLLTADTGRGIRQYLWAEDSKRLLYLQDINGDENWHLHAVDIETRKDKDLTPHPGVQVRIIRRSPVAPNKIIIGMNLRDPRVHDAYSIDIGTGEETLLVTNPGDVLEWYVDHAFVIRAALAQSTEGGYLLRVRDSAQADWRPIAVWTPNNGMPTIYGFTPAGDSIYAADARTSNTSHLVEIAISNGRTKMLASDSLYDVNDVLIHPTTHAAEAVSFYKERNEWKALDTSMERYIGLLDVKSRGDFQILDRDRNDSLWLVGYTIDANLSPVYLYDHKNHIVTFLFYDRPALGKYVLANTEPISCPARDGTPLHAYLTLPAGVSPDSLPMVVLVHGGPWGRDTWGFNPEVQWLANRGYAVLQVNFRGSTGFGKSFLDAGNKEWGRKMQLDLIDATQWVVDQGMVDPSKVAIFGTSYGGYAALAGAAFTPKQYVCAVDIVGPSNLLTLLKTIPPYWEPMKQLMYARIGDPVKDKKMLTERSPLFSAGKIAIPVLIAQGANDPRVKKSESEQIVAALKKKHKPVEYLLFPDEGHGFAKPENRLKFYEAAENFLAKYLGGRTED